MITKLGATITNKETFLRFQIKFTSSNNINMNIKKDNQTLSKKKGLPLYRSKPLLIFCNPNELKDL